MTVARYPAEQVAVVVERLAALLAGWRWSTGGCVGTARGIH